MIPKKIKLGLENLEELIYENEDLILKEIEPFQELTDISSVYFSSKSVMITFVCIDGSHFQKSYEYKDVFGLFQDDSGSKLF